MRTTSSRAFDSASRYVTTLKRSFLIHCEAGAVSINLLPLVPRMCVKGLNFNARRVSIAFSLCARLVSLFQPVRLSETLPLIDCEKMYRGRGSLLSALR